VWKNYRQVYNESHAVAKYLFKNGLCPKEIFDEGEFQFLALYSKNRAEWAITDLACAMSAVTVVTLYDTLGTESIDYIISQTKIRTIVCAAAQVKKLVEVKEKGLISDLSTIIYFDELPEDQAKGATEVGFNLVTWSQVLKEGSTITDAEANYEREREVRPETPYTFSYTSGTTGMPKGVMLSNRNFIANVGGMDIFDPNFRLRDDDVYISYLPLAHVFERFLYIACVSGRVQIGFFQGDVLKLRDDLQELKPTLMVSVPRLFCRFYDLMQQRISEVTGMKRRLIDWGTETKLKNLE